MKQIFDLFTRAEIEIIVNTGKLSEEQKALFKREGIAQKEAINYAKEVLKYLPSDEAEIEETEEEIDQDNFFAPEEEEQAEPTANFEEESQPEELMQEISEVVSHPQQEQKRTGRTALERLAMLEKLGELNHKHTKTTQMLTRIKAMQTEQKENEGVEITLSCSKLQSINISKNLAVNLCLNFVFEETDKQRRAIENEIENLDF